MALVCVLMSQVPAHTTVCIHLVYPMMNLGAAVHCNIVNISDIIFLCFTSII